MRIKPFISSLLLGWTIGVPVAHALELRSEALQRYQEALFQETGTGDLALAESLYTSLCSDFPKQRDITAVSYYHLGLIEEKRGHIQNALRHYTLLATHYPDQDRLTRQAKLKIQSLTQFQPITPAVSQIVPPDKPSTTPTPEPNSQTPVCSAASSTPALPPPFGLGIHPTGMLASYRTTDSTEVVTLVSWLSTSWTLGLRGLYHIPLSTSGCSIYSGFEVKWFYPDTSATYYATSGLVGLRILTIPDLYFGADVGYQYLNQSTATMPRISTAVISTVTLTWYLF